MASYQGHLAFSTLLGTGYGVAAALQGQMDWGPVFLGTGLTALGGLLPDLDSDSSVPVREVFGLAAAAAPFLLMQRVTNLGFSTEQTLVILGGVYLIIRYGLRTLLAKITVHRGMFHSIPAMLIAGLLVFLLYHSPSALIRLYLAGGVMLGFLSHLVLDAIYDVDLMGSKLRPTNHTGGPLKFFSPSWLASLTTYGVLGSLVYAVYLQLNPQNDTWRIWQSQALKVFSVYFNR